MNNADESFDNPHNLSHTPLKVEDSLDMNHHVVKLPPIKSHQVPFVGFDETSKREFDLVPDYNVPIVGHVVLEENTSIKEDVFSNARNSEYQMPDRLGEIMSNICIL